MSSSPHRYDRFFFAIRPDEITARAIDVFTAHEVPEGRRLNIAHQHVTLAISEDFEQYPARLAARLMVAGEEVEAGSFGLSLTRLSASRRTVALCPERKVPPLFALQTAIAAAMARHAVPLREGWSFSPHQTLCYRKGEPFSRRVEGFTWHAGEFVLIRSFVGLTRHDVIGRWPLREGAQFQLL